LEDVAEQHWGSVGDNGKQKMARMASAAAWGLGNWQSMEQYVSCIPRDTLDGAFYRAVLAVHREDYAIAQQVCSKSCPLRISHTFEFPLVLE